ncbi:uncharacterized protein METZ01_LOCUS143477, partial [marine metagenome]
IVDSQIRNKTISEHDQYQGISIELTGELTITDTTITEQLDSGIDRGDFIEEIESGLPFSNKVGVLGFTEGLSETDPISIRAKSSRITGGGVYSVNLVPSDKLFDPTKSSNIEMEVDAFEINHGTLENLTKFDNAVHTETITLEKTTGVIKPKEFPYPAVESVEVYLEGNRVFEGVDYTLRYSNRGKLLFVNFLEKLPKGSSLELVTRPKLAVLPTDISLRVAGETKMGSGSLLKASHIDIDTGELLMDNSRVEGGHSIGINSAGLLSMDNESLMRSDYVEQGAISLASSDFLVRGNSRLSGSSKIEVEAKNKALIQDESSLVVGWEGAPVISDERFLFFWDSETGEVIDGNGELYPDKFKESSLVAPYMANIYQVPESMFVVFNINQPFDYKTIPHIHISANEAVVEDVVFDSRTGENPSALRIDSVDAIRLSGSSEINRFAQAEFTADTVEMLKGVGYHSAKDAQGVPTGVLIIRSGSLTDLRGQSLDGSVIAYSDNDIQVTDTGIDGYMIKLDAEGDLTVGTGELGISPFLWARARVNLYGDNVHIKRTGIKSSMDVGIFGSNKIKIDGPTRIEAENLLGILTLKIEAPEVYLNEGTEIEANASRAYWDNQTGKIEITGKNLLKIKGARLELNSWQLDSETPNIELRGREITVDKSEITMFAYYNNVDNWEEMYSQQHTTLSGRKLILIEADESVSLINDSVIYMNSGDIKINAGDITIDDSKIVNKNVRPNASKAAGLISLGAKRNITLTDSNIYGQTLSKFKRMQVNLEGVQLDSSNSLVAIFDERKGRSGSIDLDFRKSINLESSQIVSMGDARLTADTNGNDINVKSKDLTMKDSLIKVGVDGNG